MKKLIFLCLLLLTQASLAETCPSVEDIKMNKFKDWLAYDSEEGTPLSSKQFAHFQKNIHQFALAEWANNDNTSGIVHCYYQDKHGSSLEAFLAKPNFIPDNSHKLWYSVSGSMHCAGNMEQCSFKANRMEQTQVAKK